MNQGRIYGLDTWRAGLLLVGPLIHAAPALAAALHSDPDLYGGVTRASGLFRMPVFFFIAGFLASHAQIKQIGWLKRRVVQLGVPMLSTWFLLVMPLQYLRISVFSQRGYNPVHLWFLGDLLLFSCVFSHASTILAIEKAIAPIRPIVILVGFFLASGLLAALRYPIAHIPVDVWTTNLLQAPSDAIFYLAGMMFQRNEALFALLRRRPVALSGVAMFSIAFLVIENLQGLLLPGQHHLLKLAIAGASGVVAAGMCCSIMASALTMTTRPRIVSHLSQASYSIYLLHLPVIMVAVSPLARLGAGVGVTYGLLVVTAFGVSWAIHEFVITRIAWLRFLFNGALRHAARGRSVRKPATS